MARSLTWPAGRALMIPALVVSLTACATAPSAPSPPPIAVARPPAEAVLRARCPQPVAYDRAQLTRAADEIDRLPPGSAVAAMLADYELMIRAARRCRGEAR